jgi:RNA polymerase subunit RPABC4/transcription elongation factor Spt4
MTMRFDATGDYVTCNRCRTMRPAEMRACPRCSMNHLLTVERFGLTPQQRRQLAIQNDINDAQRAAAREQEQ